MGRKLPRQIGWKVATPLISLPSMGWVSSDRIAALVERDRGLLDQAFGLGQYQIEDANGDEAIVRSAELEIRFAYDRNRARDVGAYVTLLGLPEATSYQHPVDTWARFLGEEMPDLPRDSSGIITVPPDEQVRSSLQWIARFAQEILSDPQKMRDAAYFAHGYNTAYNDWASRKGSWAASD